VLNLKQVTSPIIKGESTKVNQVLEGCPMPPSTALHQKQAVANWFANKGRGTLKMATGSGKTITALALVCELYHKINLRKSCW